MIDYSDVEEVIEKCFKEMEQASRAKYDAEQADRTAALCLMAQMKLSMLIEEIELKAKMAKNEVSRIEGECYFNEKTNSNDKKLTESMLSHTIAKSAGIVDAKRACAEAESEVKKWNYVMKTIEASHIYFRNASKSKQWAE